jgi:hypothetical protein
MFTVLVTYLKCQSVEYNQQESQGPFCFVSTMSP